LGASSAGIAGIEIRQSAESKYTDIQYQIIQLALFNHTINIIIVVVVVVINQSSTGWGVDGKNNGESR
jgi:hypothetical protein